MKSRKARSKGIRSGRSVAKIRVINIRKIRFAPDSRHLKNRSSDLKDPTDQAQHSPLFYTLNLLVSCYTIGEKKRKNSKKLAEHIQ